MRTRLVALFVLAGTALLSSGCPSEKKPEPPTPVAAEATTPPTPTPAPSTPEPTPTPTPEPKVHQTHWEGTTRKHHAR